MEINKKYNKLIILSFLSIIIILIFIGITGFLTTSKIKVKTISIDETINEDNTKTLEIEIYNPLKKKIYCLISDKEKLTESDTEWIREKDNICSFNVNAGKFYIFIKDENNNIISTETDQIKSNKIVVLTLNTNKIYLTLGETYQIKTELTSIGEVDETIQYTSLDENIVTVTDGLVTPISNGNTKIVVNTSNNIVKEIEVIVTDIYKKASLDNNTTKLPCGIYSKEQNDLLDDILKFKVQEAGGEGTRGAVVATSRFLVLEFPYRINYFFENGRLNNHPGRPYVAGEGRYYKKGLYLNEERFQYLEAIDEGPATWGCPLMNWQDESGYKPGVRYANGLDCSGFITWALYNAGLDVGDSGAGDTERTDDIGDLGKHNELTKDFVLNGSYKVGDLIGRDGHIALIAGLDEENIYIAESLVGGVVIKSFAKNGSELYKLYSFINNMDEYYKEEGNYTNMW